MTEHTEAGGESGNSQLLQEKTNTSQTRVKGTKWALGLAIIVSISLIGFLAFSTRQTRSAVQAYTKLISAVNAQNMDAVKQLCTNRYLKTHELKTAPEGGLVGFPRFIHKNFQAWREDDAIWVCPTNRVGPIYQFLMEDGKWKYDGLIGLLRSGRQILVIPEESRQSGEDEMLIGS